MPLTLHQLTGESLTLETLVALVHLLDVEEDDTILFCFWGHGIHCQWNLEPWPCLYFTKGEDYVAFEGVIELLRSFSPRLLIALADCCNTLIPAPLEARGEAAYQNNRRKQFAALFREPRGEVIITSAELGSNAYSFDSKGHVFTNGLIRSIMYQVKKQPLVTWESVLKMAEGQAIKWQRPYWEMHIR